MDVKNWLELPQKSKIGDFIELTGWLVDQKEGLFLLGEHCPENYYYPFKVKLLNGNIIYQIRRTIPALGGGWSSFFYKSKIRGVVCEKSEIEVLEIYVQQDRNSDNLEFIDINKDAIEAQVKKFGDYKFTGPRNPSDDWLDDL